MNGPTYEIVSTKDLGTGIKCLKCGQTSYHTWDLQELYCAHCREFHDGAKELKRRERAV